MVYSWPFDLFDSRRFQEDPEPIPAGEHEQARPPGSGARDMDSRQAGSANEPRVLIITQRFDPHAEVVEAALNRIGTPALRLNTEDFHSYSVNWSSEQPGLRLGQGSAHVIDLSRIVGSYFRRPLPAPAHPDLKEPEAQVFSASETEAFVGSLYALPGVRWISPPAVIQTAGAKIAQLAVATQVGLTVPRTLVTNDPTDAVQFASGLDAGLVVKPLRTSSIELETSRVEFFARRLSPSDVTRVAEYMRFAPTLLQEYVPKSSEIRVTVMGSNVFAVEITPARPDLPLDWTSVDASDFSYQPCPLPEKLEGMIREFLRWYGLQFGALDFLKTGEGEILFLENNPNGVWYWLELETGLPLADSMARLLTDPGALG
jgi:glutathione synthase/RimK-type ligase-like ATP-grasp enzyme